MDTTVPAMSAYHFANAHEEGDMLHVQARERPPAPPAQLFTQFFLLLIWGCSYLNPTPESLRRSISGVYPISIRFLSRFQFDP